MFTKFRKNYHQASQWTHHHSAVFILGLTLCAGLFGSLRGAGQTFAATLDCSTATNINVPVIECQALLDLYDSTNGGSWNSNLGWDTDTNVCTWQGIGCTNILGQDTVTSISLAGNNLNGTLPVSLSALDQMIEFDVSQNQIYGTLPVEWQTWTNMQNFDISINQISGILPTQWSGWTNMYIFDVSQNQISGTLPVEWDTWTNIQRFDVSANQITGTLPIEWDTWTNIQQFAVFQNQISGTLPVEWQTWTGLSGIGFEYNQISGTLPVEWQTWSSMKVFNGGFNQISGTLPVEWQTWSSIDQFSVESNQLSGTLPVQWSTWTDIAGFAVAGNQITGTLPIEWDTWTNIRLFRASANQINGILPVEWDTWTNIQYFQIESNQLSGTLPAAWQTWTGIQQFDVSFNQITGPLPAVWSTRSNIYSFFVEHNQIRGTLPVEWDTWTTIQVFAAGLNDLSGPLPVEWQTWTGIQQFSVIDNKLTGSVPDQWATQRQGPVGEPYVYVYLENNCLTTTDYDSNTQNWINTYVGLIPQSSCVQADLYVSKTILTPGPYTAGMEVTYYIEYGNNGPDTVDNGMLYDVHNDGISISGTSMPYTTVTVPPALETFLQSGNSCFDQFISGTTGPYAETLYQQYPDIQDALSGMGFTGGSNRSVYLIDHINGLGGPGYFNTRFLDAFLLEHGTKDIWTVYPECMGTGIQAHVFSLGTINPGETGHIYVQGTITDETSMYILNSAYIAADEIPDDYYSNNGAVASVERQNYCGDGITDTYQSGFTPGDILSASYINIYPAQEYQAPGDYEVTSSWEAVLTGGAIAQSYERSMQILAGQLLTGQSAQIIGSNTGSTVQTYFSGSEQDIEATFILSVTITTTDGYQVTNNARLIGGILVTYMTPTSITISGSTVTYDTPTIFMAVSGEASSSVGFGSEIIGLPYYSGELFRQINTTKIAYDLYNNGIDDIISFGLFPVISHNYTSTTGGSINTKVSRSAEFLDGQIPGEYINQEILLIKVPNSGGLLVEEQCDGEEFCTAQCTIQGPICPDGGCLQPQAGCTLTANKNSGSTPLNVQFTPQLWSGSAFSYIDYGDGSTGTSMSHTYTTTGNMQPTFHVYNVQDSDINGSCKYNIQVSSPTITPTPTPITTSIGGGRTPVPTQTTHQAGPVINELKGKACIYNDEQYVAKGPFSDTLGHRGFPYIDIVRISCLNRGRGTNKGLWIYEPDKEITKAETLKTIVKILGIEFEDFTITHEDLPYLGQQVFVDTPNWFKHYESYAYNNGLTDGLYTTDKNNKKYLNPEQPITRYEAIKLIMLAYNKINNKNVDISKKSVLGDVIDPSNPYYAYIRQAEVLGFISGIPQKNGGYDFVGQKNLTRAEFAKIIGVPFSEQLFYIDDIIINSDIYKTTIKSINKSNKDNQEVLEKAIIELDRINTTVFLNEFKIDKKVFIEGLRKIIQAQIDKE